MKLIALTGLVFVEKIDLAKMLAERESKIGHSVTIIDGGDRMSIKPDTLPVPVVQLEGDLDHGVPRLLRATEADTIILIVSEYLPPDLIFASLDALYGEFPNLELQMVALIDTRTCDCFPQVREQFESFADVVVQLPVIYEEVAL